MLTLWHAAVQLIQPNEAPPWLRDREPSRRSRMESRGRKVGPKVTVMIEWFGGSRSALTDLFALADDSPEQVERYRDLGRVLVARDGPTVIGHLQLVGGERSDETEVKSLAVREDYQGSGIGPSLMNRAIAICHEEHRRALLVATAAADTGVLRFYQRLGFRFLRVERDVFTPEAGYPPAEIDGVPLRDQIWLSLTLDGSRVRPGVTQLRVARHTDRLDELVRFYRDGLGLVEVGGFRNHNGYDGVFLAVPGTSTHLELTSGGSQRGSRRDTVDGLDERVSRRGFPRRSGAVRGRGKPHPGHCERRQDGEHRDQGALSTCRHATSAAHRGSAEAS